MDLSFNCLIGSLEQPFTWGTFLKAEASSLKTNSEKLAHIFITSRLDNYEIILAGCLNNSLKLFQLIQNTAARILNGTAKQKHISPMLSSLHWLLMPIMAKLQTTIKISSFPNNPQELFIVISTSSKPKMGGRTFSFQAPLLWNQLPVWVWDSLLLRLKTYFKTKKKNKPFSCLIIP